MGSTLRRTGGVSALSFAVVFTALTVLRARNAAPPASVQSVIVDGAAVVVVCSVAFCAYRSESFAAGWLLAFGPTLAFALNLLQPVSVAGPLVTLAQAVAGGAVVSLPLALTGYVAGRGLRVFANAGRRPATRE